MNEALTAGWETLGNGRNIPFTKLLPLDRIELREKFQKLFDLNQLNIDKIAGNMRAGGFDAAQPLHIWKSAEGRLILIDGHHRRMAARAVGITEVPCYLHEFADEDDAELYAIGLQTERRNLSDGDLMGLLPRIDELRKRGRGTGLSGVKGKSAEQTAQILHTSLTKVEKGRYVRKYGGDELNRRVESNEVTLNQAYLLIKEQQGGADSDEKKPDRKDAQRVFLGKAVSLLIEKGENRGAELLIEAFLPEDERETFRMSLQQGEQG